MSGYEFAFMGHIITFDAVTGYGLLCAAIFFTGFCFALSNEHKMKRAKNRPRHHPHVC